MASIGPGEHVKQAIAKKDLIIHDSNLRAHRQIVAGQPVPLDLIEEYEKETGHKVSKDDEGKAETKASEKSS